MKSDEKFFAGDASIGVTEKNKDLAKTLLDTLLASDFVLYVKTLNFHWNMEGPRFVPFHKLLNDQYEQLAEMLDEMAEATRQLDRKSVASMAEFQSLSHIKEQPGVSLDETAMISALLSDHERIIANLRMSIAKAEDAKELGDIVDYLVSWLEKHQKMAWMLRASLRK